MGIAADGVVIYPVTNNTLVYSITAGEVTTTGSHVGRGMGFHYHADGHSLTGNGINLYNLDDYNGSSHPPLIGFIFDSTFKFVSSSFYMYRSKGIKKMVRSVFFT